MKMLFTGSQIFFSGVGYSCAKRTLRDVSFADSSDSTRVAERRKKALAKFTFQTYAYTLSYLPIDIWISIQMLIYTVMI